MSTLPFPVLPPDEDGGGGRMLAILFVAAGVIAALYLLFGRGKPVDEAADHTATVQTEERAARTWADKLGRRITGVSCTGVGRCTVAPEGGAPFEVLCAAGECRLVGCGR